jgi:hypothetical protein
MILRRDVSYRVVGESGKFVGLDLEEESEADLVYIFKKNEKDDVTKTQLEDLKKIVETEYK